MTATAAQLGIDFAAQRRIMVDRQIRTFDVTDAAVLTAMLEAPRERFLPESLAPLAYSDGALQIGRAGEGENRRLLAPMILARMLQAAQVQSKDACLDVAGGGGYGASLLARLGASALAVENAESLTERAGSVFAELGVANARAQTGSLIDGGGASGPFNVILINGAVEEPPAQLLSLLAENGRLVAIYKDAKDPTGSAAQAMLWRRSDGRFGRLPLFNAAAPVLPGFAAKKAFAF
jgi:protein-L-isoaspartate(D-aspartate) O-methyltransferase